MIFGMELALQLNPSW